MVINYSTIPKAIGQYENYVICHQILKENDPFDKIYSFELEQPKKILLRHE